MSARLRLQSLPAAAVVQDGYARQLYSFVQANNIVSDADKDSLGVTVRTMPTPIPPPSDLP